MMRMLVGIHLESKFDKETTDDLTDKGEKAITFSKVCESFQ